MVEGNVVDETVGNIFGKLGITGMAAALITIIFGVIILLNVVSVELIVGLYLIIIGIIQLVQYIPTVTTKQK